MLAVASVILAAISKLELVDVESTSCNEYDFRCNEKAWIVSSKLSFGFHALFG